jgi:predicted phage terminase large subunit-like protein
VLIIDDPYKDAKQADSKAWKQTVEDFWREVALTRLAPGAPVVLIQTRWRQDDLPAGCSQEGDDWTVLNIPAQADHDPEKGETDVLGREPGEFMESARRRVRSADWLKKIREVGSRTWNALYQGRPSPAEGTIFKRDWWQRVRPAAVDRTRRRHPGRDRVRRADDLVGHDVQGHRGHRLRRRAGVGRRGADAYLLDQVHGRMDFVETCNAFRQLAAKWPQALLKLVEDKANGPAVIASLRRTVPGIVPEEPQGGKEARAAAVSPLVEAGNVWLPAPSSRRGSVGSSRSAPGSRPRRTTTRSTP